MPDNLARRIGLGITLDMDATGSNTFVSLGAVVDGFTHSGAKRDVSDNSILSDLYKKKAVGQIDPGERTFEIAYDPGVNTTASRLKSALEDTSGTEQNFRISWPAVAGGNNATTKQFYGFVSGLGQEVRRAKWRLCL